jgi:4-oxalocrotonate tautomerase
MPTLHVELFAGRSVELKRRLAAALTEATVATLGGSPAGVQVIFVEVERHNWATGGTLWSDQPAAPPAPAAPDAGD